MSKGPKLRSITGSVCAPLGFQAAAVYCDIKKVDTGKGSDKGAKRDLGLIVSDVPAAVAGMFTTNKVCAAPVKLSAKVAGRGTARVIVVNSGNANACTGQQGVRDAKKMAALTAERVTATRYRAAGNPACDAGKRQTGLSASHRAKRRFSSKVSPNDVFVCSTGRIGIPMPMKNVERGIRACAPLLARSTRSARDVAEAIMTSDTCRKEIAVELKLDGKPVRVGGICKGAGMIQPRMSVAKARPRRGVAPRHSSPRRVRPAADGAVTAHATMLAFITSDAAIAPGLLRAALAEAVNQSFNRISVDGDMSTNDSVIALANGLAKNRPITKRDRGFRDFQAAMTFVCVELAKMIVHDGEGVSRFVTLRIHNAASDADAEKAARSIASSSLVRTSWCGGDPNWGRILGALGYSGASMDENRTDIGYSASGRGPVLHGFRHGAPTNVPLKKLAQITAAPEFDVHVDLRRGRAGIVFYASDLTEEYVTFNKGDITDPASLGG